jgi:hypothetical protein
MKKILAALAVATALGSPAAAQSYDPSVGSGNIAPQASAPQLRLHNRFYVPHRAQEAYAQVPHAGRVAPFVGRRGYTDPDPSIRSQLYRESLRGRW